MKKQPVILIIILAVTLGFIWIHSMFPQDVSANESNWVMSLVSPFLEIFVGKGNVTEHLVRKLAHFSEFAVLGCELAFLFRNAKCATASAGRAALWKVLPWAFLHALFVAVTDETIQIFSGRGPAITDVWIDVAGGMLGCVIVILIMFLSWKEELGEK